MPKDEPSFEDPLELQGIEVAGDPEEMAEIIVEEYVRMGASDAQLGHLFKTPFFGITHALYKTKGEAWCEALIQKVREKWGYFQFRREVKNA